MKHWPDDRARKETQLTKVITSNRSISCRHFTLNKKCQPHDDARWRVNGSTQSLRYSHQNSWPRSEDITKVIRFHPLKTMNVCIQNGHHPKDIEIFQSGLSLTTIVIPRNCNICTFYDPWPNINNKLKNFIARFNWFFVKKYLTSIKKYIHTHTHTLTPLIFHIAVAHDYCSWVISTVRYLKETVL